MAICFKMPNCIINDTELNAYAKALITVFVSHSNANGFCHKSGTELAALAGISKSTVATARAKLMEKGYITYTRSFRWSKRLKRVVYGKNAYRWNMDLLQCGYTLIPRTWLHELKHISVGAFAILLYLAELAAFDKKEHRAFPSIQTMSERVGIGLSTVKRKLRELKHIPQLKVEPCRNQENGEYSENSYFVSTVLEPIVEAVKPVVEHLVNKAKSHTAVLAERKTVWQRICKPIRDKLRHWLSLLRGVGPNLDSN